MIVSKQSQQLTLRLPARRRKISGVIVDILTGGACGIKLNRTVALVPVLGTRRALKRWRGEDSAGECM
jgi:hypothetical protein